MNEVTFSDSDELQLGRRAHRTTQMRQTQSANDRVTTLVLFFVIVVGLLETWLFFSHALPHTITAADKARLFLPN